MICNFVTYFADSRTRAKWKEQRGNMKVVFCISTVYQDVRLMVQPSH